MSLASLWSNDFPTLFEGETHLHTFRSFNFSRTIPNGVKTHRKGNCGILTSHRICWKTAEVTTTASKGKWQWLRNDHVAEMKFNEPRVALPWNGNKSIELHLRNGEIYKLKGKGEGFNGLLSQLEDALRSVRQSHISYKEVNASLGMKAAFEQTAERRKINRSVAVAEAEDLSTLRASAEEIADLASKLQHQAQITEVGDVSQLLSQYGIASGPVRFDAGLNYFEELADSLEKVMDLVFTEKVFRESDGVQGRVKGIVLLHELYCAYYRAGSRRVSPQDFVCAVKEICNRENSRYCYTEWQDKRIRAVQLKSLSGEAMTARIISLLKEKGVDENGIDSSVTTTEVAEAFESCAALILVHLQAAEESGHLCRDESLGALRFYINKFITP